MNKIINLYSLKRYKKRKPKSFEEIMKMNIKIKNEVKNLIYR